VDDLVLHEGTRAQLQRFVATPSHALMLIAPEGAGKRTVSLQLAKQVLQLRNLTELAKHPYFFLIEPDEGYQKIEAIRSLQTCVRLKTPGSAAIRRVIIIEAAHTMTVQAQNALLKLLEEPPVDTLIILNVAGRNNLLPTVYSRTQKIQLVPPAKELLLSAFTKKGYQAVAIESAYHLSGGQVGLLAALLEQDDSHPLTAHIAEAKRIFTMSQYERLSYVGKLVGKKPEIPALLQAMQRIARAALLQAGSHSRVADVACWHRRVRIINSVQQRVVYNANSKLLLTSLLLEL